MYKEYFGLSDEPFSIAPDPHYLYMSEQHREALAHLAFGMNAGGGFILLTGEVGTGKTTVCRCLLEQIPEGVNVALILNPKLEATELLASICDELQIQYPDNNTSIKVFVDCINKFLLEEHSKGRKTVLIIEEAQNLDANVLEQIRMLTNLETSQRKLLQIIMVGQPELLDNLAKPEMKQLAQRITARFHLRGLSLKDTDAYVTHRLAVAGMRGRLFSHSVLKRLYRLSGGVPRQINVLCDRALLGTYVQNRSHVDKKTLEKAAKEVFGEEKSNPLSLNKINIPKIHIPKVKIGKRKIIRETATTRKAPAIRVTTSRNHQMWKIAGGLVTTLFLVLFSVYMIEFSDTNTNINTAVKDGLTKVKEKKLIVDKITDQKVAEKVAERKAPIDLLPRAELKWPGGAPKYRVDIILSYKALFDLWGLGYDPKDNGIACKYAHTMGLMCSRSQGTIKELRELNRPAVLKLVDDKGIEFLVTLSGLDGDVATVILNKDSKKVAIKDLKVLWSGDYTLFWREPPGYRGPIKIGSTGPDVEWLAIQISRAKGEVYSGENKGEYTAPLSEQVRYFQLSKDLRPDGVVDMVTLIHLNSVLSNNVPFLLKKSLKDEDG